MKSATTIITMLLLMVLTACSNDKVKVENNGDSTEKVSVEVNKETNEKEEENAALKKVDLKEYNFEEFKTISEGEQKEYMQALMSNLGYTDALGNWILSLINDPQSQIPGSINTISEYANFYVTEVEIQDGYKLDWKLEEEKKEAKSGNTEDDIVTIKDPITSEPIAIPKKLVAKRIDAISKEPLFEIEPNGQFSLLGIGTGYSFDYVKNLLGEPDKVGVIEGGNNNIYYIPGDTLRDGLEFYQLVILVSEDTITGVRLNMNNKEEFERSMEIPNEFSTNIHMICQ
ncbi:hypothetical protein ACQCT3_02565 [Sutcliffiella horikoshii]|uniref:hypothetical protein n=1 Tax=Sutcliffiella horikoshii TaxID=79883 RepID=UPI003CE75E85